MIRSREEDVDDDEVDTDSAGDGNEREVDAMMDGWMDTDGWIRMVVL
jgi:hypothetical protein